MKQKRMRQLRDKYGISLRELERYSSLTPQRLSQIELDTRPVVPRTKQHMETAFKRLIKARRQNLADLEADFQKHRRNLLDIVDGEELL